MKFKRMKIDKDSIITGTGRGVQYCCTTPVHPQARALGDRDKKYIEVHRVVMENHIGRYIDPEKGEEVHHKDRNPRNNALSNLELKTKSEHQKEHANKDKRWEKSEFWKKSPRTKPGQIRKVVRSFLNVVSSSDSTK